MGRAKCVPQGEGSRGYVKTPGLVSRKATSRRVPLRMGTGGVRDASKADLRSYLASERGVRAPLCVAAVRFRWPFTFLACRLRAAVIARPSCSPRAPSKAWTTRTEGPRSLLFKRRRRQASPLPVCCDLKRGTLTLRPELQTMRLARRLRQRGGLFVRRLVFWQLALPDACAARNVSPSAPAPL